MVLAAYKHIFCLKVTVLCGLLYICTTSRILIKEMILYLHKWI